MKKIKKRDLFLLIIVISICLVFGIFGTIHLLGPSCYAETICSNLNGEEVCSFSSCVDRPMIWFYNTRSIIFISLIFLIFISALLSIFKKIAKKWVLVFILLFIVLIIAGNIIDYVNR